MRGRLIVDEQAGILLLNMLERLQRNQSSTDAAHKSDREPAERRNRAA